MMEIISTRQYPEDYLERVLESLKAWTYYIENNQNFSFIKFGDGEFFCMMGKEGTNCDNHNYSPELGRKLIDAWNYFANNTTENIYIAEWADQPGSFGTPQGVYPIQNTNNPVFAYLQNLLLQNDNKFHLVNFEILLQNTLSLFKYNFFKSIKYSTRKKVFVGPVRLTQVTNFLNTNVHIQVPLPNSFKVYDKILDNCKKLAVDDTIFIFSSGMPTKSLIAELLQYKENITCLDAGSSFDAMFVGGTREGQLTTDVIKNYYKELL